MQEQPRNRDWVKNAAIIFLVVILVLTFFSNTIMNRTLPEVATQEVTSGSIVARVRGTGTVQANSNTQVKMDQNRVIRSVLVKVGQQVKAGDVLFTLGEGASEDIDAAEDKLRSLQTSYNKIAATMPEFSYGADHNRLAHLEEAYNEAKIAYDAAREAALLATPNQEQKAKAEQALAAAIEAQKAAEKNYKDALNNATGVNTKDTYEDLRTEQNVILERLHNNAQPYYIDGFLYGGKDTTETDRTRANLILDSFFDAYDNGNGYLSGEEAIERQISFVEHRISMITSPLTGDIIEPNTTTYNITWIIDENRRETTTVNAGEIPAYYGTVEKQPSEGKNYIFDGWEPNPVEATGDTEYRARFIEEPITYEITWNYDNGQFWETTTVNHGDYPDHTAPDKTNQEPGKTYTFDGWIPSLESATGNTSYTASFSEEPIEYSINWKDDEGNTIDTTTVQYGEIPTHEDLQKPNSEDGTIYTFSGWTPAITAATDNAEYQATYTVTENITEEIDPPQTPENTEEIDPPQTPENTGEIDPSQTPEKKGEIVSPQTLEETVATLASGQGANDQEEDNNGDSTTVVKVEGPNDINININVNTGGTTSEENGTATQGGDNTPSQGNTNGGSSTSTPTVDYDELKFRKMQLASLQAALDDYQIIQESINSIWNDAALIAAREAYETAVEDVEKWKTAFDVLANSGDTPQSAAYKNAKSAFESAEEAYLQARQTLRDKIANNENTITGYNIDLADLWQQITKTKEKLEDLLGGEEAQITAKVSGTIQTLNAAPGDTKKKDDVLATIEAPDMGYMMSFSVTNDQASRLRVGDTGTVSNFYWGDEITATLKSIQIDQKNPATNKLLTFDLSGNVTAGSELTVSVGQKSANYDVIIPSSSVRTDANGTYVLKMESKNSPLGNRYLARRVPVEVLAVDDTNSAVSADLGYGDYVITSSSAPLKNGQMVRLATSS